MLTCFFLGGTPVLAGLAPSGGCPLCVSDQFSVFERGSALHVAAGLTRRLRIAGGTPC